MHCGRCRKFRDAVWDPSLLTQGGCLEVVHLDAVHARRGHRGHHGLPVVGLFRRRRSDAIAIEDRHVTVPTERVCLLCVTLRDIELDPCNLTNQPLLFLFRVLLALRDGYRNAFFGWPTARVLSFC